MAEQWKDGWPPVRVAGCGAISAVGRGVESLRSALRTNASGLRPSERFDPARYHSNIVGQAPMEDGLEIGEDPACYLAGIALTEARQEAMGLMAELRPERIGFVLSTTKANIEGLQRMMEGRPCSERARRHVQANLLAADLAAEHGVRGPVQTVSLACASGLVALQQGAKMIQRGSVDAVLVVGVDHLSEFVVAGFAALKALDPGGCRPFDRDRRGLSPGEAGAAIVLARNGEEGVSQVSLRGWGNSNDANHMTGPSRDGSGLALAIQRALAMSGLDATEIDYVSAHGTGTTYNDAMECKALGRVFGDGGPAVSGAKGMLGHTLGAAGVVESVLCVTALRDRIVPGTPRLSCPDEGAPANLRLAPAEPARFKHVLKISVGFGGVNSAIVFSCE